jgi:hypothetical protein
MGKTKAPVYGVPLKNHKSEIIKALIKYSAFIILSIHAS